MEKSDLTFTDLLKARDFLLKKLNQHIKVGSGDEVKIKSDIQTRLNRVEERIFKLVDKV